MTGLGDLVPAGSCEGRRGEASSLGSLAGLLTLCLLFECDLPLNFAPRSDLDFFFLLLWPSDSDFRFKVPLGVLSSEELLTET
jgi:hypothetical protein